MQHYKACGTQSPPLALRERVPYLKAALMETLMTAKITRAFILGGCMLSLATWATAQAAGAGADFNKKERAQIQEQKRLEKVDPPIRPDPVGNALIGGAVTGTMKGAAAGALSTVRGAGVGTAVQAAKDEIAKNKVENAKTGRGGKDDPRYNPATLPGR